MGYLDYAGLQYLWGKLKEKFAPKSHSHDDRYYTEAEMDGKLSSKVDNNEAGANGLFSKLTTSWTATPTDNTYFIRQDTGGGNEFGRVKFSTLWNYIKGKTDGVYQPKGNYAAASHTHNYAGSGSAGGSANSAIKLDSSAGSATQPVYFKDGKPVATTYALNKTVPADAKFTDTNTWRGIQNNLTSDSTDQSLSAAQGKALKALVDGKAPTSHKHTKSQITDFPSSMPASDVYAWAKAATKPSYTKAEVGLGNVDNTADKDKSVKYATSAGNGTVDFQTKVTTDGYFGAVRFGNGVQICWFTMKSARNRTFLLPFADINYAIAFSGGYCWLNVNNRTTTNFTVGAEWSGYENSYIAIGRWK